MLSAPRLEIKVQPEQTFAFRENSKENSFGKLRGRNGRNSFPEVKLQNYAGNAWVIAGLVLSPFTDSLHPYQLIFDGKVAINGMVLQQLSPEKKHNAIFSSLSIRKLKTNQIKLSIIEAVLAEHSIPYESPLAMVDGVLFDKQDRVKHAFIDSGELCKEVKERIDKMNLSQCRLSFQAFDIDRKPLTGPVFSEIISDKKTIKELVVERISEYSSHASGKEELWIATPGLSAKDNQLNVCFYEERTGWLHRVLLGKTDIINKFLLILKTPPYQNQNITQPVEVSIYLESCGNSNKVSESHAFCYIPNEPDPQGIQYKVQKPIPTELLSFDLEKCTNHRKRPSESSTQPPVESKDETGGDAEDKHDRLGGLVLASGGFKEETPSTSSRLSEHLANSGNTAVSPFYPELFLGWNNSTESTFDKGNMNILPSATLHDMSHQVGFQPWQKISKLDFNGGIFNSGPQVVNGDTSQTSDMVFEAQASIPGFSDAQQSEFPPIGIGEVVNSEASQPVNLLSTPAIAAAVEHLRAQESHTGFEYAHRSRFSANFENGQPTEAGIRDGSIVLKEDVLICGNGNERDSLRSPVELNEESDEVPIDSTLSDFFEKQKEKESWELYVDTIERSN